jgi:hypothetical protein
MDADLWCGRRIEDLTRDELLAAFRSLAAEIHRVRALPIDYGRMADAALNTPKGKEHG